MRVINEDTNPLIIQHRKARSDGNDAPMPAAFGTYGEFLVAHRNWLREMRLQNQSDMRRTYRIVKEFRQFEPEPTGRSLLFAYLTKVIHYRKEYDAFLVRGIDACTRHIEGR